MRIVAVFLVLIGVVGAGLWHTLNSFNHFGEVERAFNGRCAPVTGVAGPEDIALDAKRGLAFISSLDRRDGEARGAIHLVNPEDPLAAGGWRDMTGGVPEAFRPLGLSYYEDEDHRRLFVVNEAAHAVELFAVADDGALTHLETFVERRMTSPNNVVAAGPRSFYVTNDAKSGREGFAASFSFLTRSAQGDILFTDGVTWRVAASGLRFANGVALSPDGGTLYAAETSGYAVKVYDRDMANGALRHIETMPTPSAPDNLSVDENGAVWIAGLPKPLALPLHARDPEATAPSAVMRVGGESGIETVYRDDGSELSASSAAARLGGTLMIGALYENKFLLCDLPADAF
jgi:arylesterase/paraoxonase